MPRLLTALCLAAALPACSAPRIPGITPYKIDIQQGNFVSQEMVSQLKPGMSKEQVRLTLGTPLLADAFHADRWDYVYYRQAPNGKTESRKLAVFFSDNKLVRADGDIISLDKPLELPAPKPAAQQTSPAPASQSAAQPAPEGPAAATPSVTQPPTQAPAPAPASPPPPPPTPTQAPPAQETR
jgi:outer membrane protein assembly factor BamE